VITPSRRRRVLVVLAVLAISAAAVVTVAFAEPLSQKPTPHPIEGREDCLLCHGQAGVKPVPASHSGRTNETCRACHPVSAASASATPAATPAPTAVQPAATATAPGPNDGCLSCHSNPKLTTNLADGKPLSLYVDQGAFSASVHGAKNLRCIDCHSDISGYPHPALQAKDARDYALSAYQLCQKCHPANFAQAQDSMHAQVLKASNRFAPVCTDCHGAHDVVKPDSPRTRITATCAKCHQPIYDTYRQSVHGMALVDEQNQDVPTCIDCHGVHKIPDPRTALFRLESPEVCARCHTDEKLMAKYGLSTKVYSTYSEDFHGTTVEFYKTKWTTIWCYKAVCTDCHGIHDIRKPADPSSSVNPQNLINTCRKCHPDAPPAFASAWTGHLTPTLDRVAPVYYVELFYKIMIPLIIGAMLVYVLMDFTRTMLDRRAAAAARAARIAKAKGRSQ